MRAVGRGTVDALRTVIAPRSRAYGHSGSDSYVYVVVGDGVVSGSVHYPVTDLNQVLGFGIPSDELGALRATEQNRTQIEAYTAAHLVIGTGASDWTLAFTGNRVLERRAGSYVILDYEVAQSFEVVPRRFTVWYDGVIHAIPDRRSLVIVKTRSGFGPLVTDHERVFPCLPRSTFHDIVLDEDSMRNDLVGSTRFASATVKEYLRRARKRLSRMVRERSLR